MLSSKQASCSIQCTACLAYYLSLKTEAICQFKTLENCYHTIRDFPGNVCTLHKECMWKVLHVHSIWIKLPTRFDNKNKIWNNICRYTCNFTLNKNLEGNSHSPFKNTVPEFASWVWRRPQKTSVKTLSSNWLRFEPQYLTNTNAHLLQFISLNVNGNVSSSGRRMWRMTITPCRSDTTISRTQKWKHFVVK